MKNQHEELLKLPNIGKNLADRLSLAGIENVTMLQLSGAEVVFNKLRALEHNVCINTLYAIEGAIQGIRWHDLDVSRKEELKEFFFKLNNV